MTKLAHDGAPCPKNDGKPHVFRYSGDGADINHNARCIYCGIAPNGEMPSGPAKLAADLRAAYEKCKQWPEDTPAGQVALLEIRNMVPEIISVLERCAEHHKGTG